MMTTLRLHLSDNELMRYARQLLLAEWSVEAQLNLANSVVVIVGVGGLGCPTASLLARAGVGELVLIDNDNVEASNLQRQTLFNANDIGMNKATCAEKKLLLENEFSNYIGVVDRLNSNNVGKLLSSADLIIDCSDNFETRDLINRFCVQHKKAFISSAAIGQSGQLAFYDFSVEEKNEQPCYACVFGTEKVQEERCSDIGVLTPTTHVVASQATHVAMHFLGLKKNILKNKLLVWEGANLKQKSYHIKRNNICTVCG